MEFRLIVFRPFKGETLLGKISSAGPEGLNSTLPTRYETICDVADRYIVRTDFFEEIFVPYKELPDGSELYAL